MQRRLVEVHHNGDARHQEEQPHHGGSFGVTDRLEGQSNQPQNQRQIEEPVPSTVVHHFPCEGIPIPQPLCVDEIHTAQPVSIEKIPVPLHVILLADEVPKEVPEVHPTHLVIREEPEVLALSGHQIFQNLVQAAFGLQHLPNVFLVARLVGALGQAAKVVFLSPLLALQLLDIPLAVVEPWSS